MCEKDSENFLEKEGFAVIPRSFSSSKLSLKKSIEKVGVPFVMKVSGKKIIHKNEIDGIRLNVKTYSNAIKEFNELKKIKGANGVLFQSKITGKEFLIGVKKTREFGHVIGFGSGGTGVEEKKDVAFRVTPLEKEDVRDMIKDTKVSIGLLRKDGEVIEKVILKISELVEKYPKISELDINPFMIKDGVGMIVDARIVWE